ncbi:MAG TPA: CapA family protein [Candidatus Limnocylindrales bacterium]|nr:CapA family protein [Candidatus Limnocylindrales bacterium]
MHKVHIAYAALALLLVATVGVFWIKASQTAEALWMGGAISEPVSTPSALPSTPASGGTAQTITLGAVGDIIMGDAPGSMPANDGRGFFDKVKSLFAVDLMMGNMEEPITEDTGFAKCGPEQTSCHQFRVPPSYAAHLRDAGFHLLNQANNHGYDYGPAGYTNTQKSLTNAGLKYTGPRNYVSVVEVKGVKVAVLGFSSYDRDNSLLSYTQAKSVVQKASGMADLVVIQVHWGAEGSGMTHVKPGTEMFLGENRGDPMAFSRAVIDAGADLIIGHGPHTLRGFELYKGRLIAYSLGNFAGGKGLKGDANLGWGAVLHTTVKPDGSFVSGKFNSTYFVTNPGVPNPDGQNRGLGLVRDLTKSDFPNTGPTISSDGVISLH